jgi:hypothetical protein
MAEVKTLRRGEKPPRDVDHILVVHRRGTHDRSSIVHEISGSAQRTDEELGVLIGPNLMSGNREKAVAEAISIADAKGIPVVYVRDDT